MRSSFRAASCAFIAIIFGTSALDFAGRIAATRSHEHLGKSCNFQKSDGASAANASRELETVARAAAGPTLSEVLQNRKKLSRDDCPESGPLKGYGCAFGCLCAFYQTCSTEGGGGSPKSMAGKCELSHVYVSIATAVALCVVIGCAVVWSRHRLHSDFLHGERHSEPASSAHTSTSPTSCKGVSKLKSVHYSEHLVESD
eukprot:TRINITY_DN72315_c0_g1_i1.p1 TRINITY_DN72315_c0_g1~~TRINITY_DN72315_c0_g1_i1.p1  ORF type:complete len:200 (+),score=21.99 TRINITY_DN72315_c0_g1_i1:49-648(+)